MDKIIKQYRKTKREYRKADRVLHAYFLWFIVKPLKEAKTKADFKRIEKILQPMPKSIAKTMLLYKIDKAMEVKMIRKMKKF